MKLLNDKLMEGCVGGGQPSSSGQPGYFGQVLSNTVQIDRGIAGDPYITNPPGQPLVGGIPLGQDLHDEMLVLNFGG